MLAAGIVLTAILAASCSQESLIETSSSNEALVSLNVTLPGSPATRAYSDGYSATNLSYAVYEADYSNLATEGTATFDGSLTTTVNVTLIKGVAYKLAFWAQAEGAPYTFSAADQTVTVSYTDAVCNDESRDAFYNVVDYTPSASTGTLDVDLYRPFAQINFLTSDFAEDAVKDYVANMQSSITITGNAYKTLNLLTGEASDAENVSFAAAAIPTSEDYDEIPVADYDYVAMAYVLVGATSGSSDVFNDVTLEATSTNTAGTSMDVKVSVDNVPVQRNYRTNIYGALLTEQTAVTVEIKPAYDGENNEDQDSDEEEGGDTEETTYADVAKEGTVITIIDPSATASETSITYAFADGGFSNATEPGTITLSDGTTITFAQNEGSNPAKYYDSGSAVRMYALNSMTVTGASAIAEIVLTCTSSSYMGNTDLYATIDRNAWTVVNDNSSDNGNTQLRIVSITITYAEGEGEAGGEEETTTTTTVTAVDGNDALEFSEDGVASVAVDADVTEYSFNITTDSDWTVESDNDAVTLSSVAQSSVSTNGSGNATVTAKFPANESTEAVTTNITINTREETLTIAITQAAAAATEGGDEETAGDGTLENPYSVAEALAIINEGSYTTDKVYVEGIISSGVSISTTYGNANYYISDDGGTTSELYVYRGYTLGGADFTAEDEIKVGDKVIVYGALTLYTNSSGTTTTPEINSGNYLYSLNGVTDYLYTSVSSLSVSSGGGEVSFTVTTNVDYTVSSSDATNFAVTPADGTVTVTCEANTGTEARTATITVTPAEGSGASEITVSITQSAPLSEDATYYKKVTEELTDWSGKYLIVYEDGPYAFDGSLTSLDGTGDYQTVTITDDAIESTESVDAMAFIIAAVDGGYSIQSASGYYIGATSTSKNTLLTSTDTIYTNTISYDSTNGTVITSEGGATLLFYSSGDSSRFRFYHSSQKAIALYKLAE